ncbi:MAG: TonB-dependent siderophore receptor, partial [Gammaproteobacteria bacterium]|nr:TonB-dependent siderophore receptor [Gammaproteobacteria bacterium]
MGATAALLPLLAAAQQSSAAAANDDDESVLQEIVVTADRPNSFAADLVQAGTFRGAALIDTPLTVNVLTRELLDAQQVTQLYDALRNTAGVTSAQLNNALYSNMAIRGIVVENRGNYRLNGALPIINLIDLPIENKERVEVLKGVSALYYGFTTPSGIVNLTSKRPPAERVLDATVFANRFGSVGGHVDYGQQFADGRFGVRVNALWADLDIGLDHSSGDRSFGSVAADWAATDTLKFEVDLERIDKTYSEPTTYFVATPMSGAPILPPLPNPEKNLGGEWMQGDGYENNALLTARWRVARDWELSASGGRSYLDRNRYFSQFQNYNLGTGNGTVQVTLTNGNINENNNYRGELSGAFFTGPLKHELTLGFTQNKREAEVTTNPTATYAQNLYDPVEPAEIALPARVVRTANEIDDQGLYLFDRISYREWLQLLVGVRQTDYESQTLTLATGARARYEADETTPAFGLVIKPREGLSFYGTYIEGLEEGGVAGPTTVNAGEILPPNTSEQFELGIKAEFGRTLATLGYFDIDRASAFVNTAINRFVQDGRTSYKGFEFSLSGEITDSLSVYATAMSLDATQERTANAALAGLRPENTPEFTGTRYSTNSVPVVPGLAVSGGVFHTGDRPINQ